MEESGKKSNPPSQEEQEENLPLEKNNKWTREFSWRKDMKKMTSWNVIDYNTKHLHLSSFGHEMKEMLLKEVAKYMLKSEYRNNSMAFALKIPYRYTFWIYFMTFKQMSMSSSAPCSLSEFNLEVGREVIAVHQKHVLQTKKFETPEIFLTGTFSPSAASYPHSTSNWFPKLSRVQQRRSVLSGMWPRLNHCGRMTYQNSNSICFN